MSEQPGEQEVGSVHIEMRVVGAPPAPATEPATTTGAAPRGSSSQAIIASIIAFLIIALVALMASTQSTGNGEAGQAVEEPTNAVSVSEEVSETTNRIITSSAPQATAAPEIVSFENPTVTIKLYDPSEEIPSEGTVAVQILGGGKPLQRQEILLMPAVQTISGEWAFSDDVHPVNYQYEVDVNGKVSTVLPAGDYVLANAIPDANWNEIYGSWGILGKSYFEGWIQVVPFQVGTARLVEIIVSLAQLDVGVLTPDGLAVSNAWVRVVCQGEDIAGNPVVVDDVEGCGWPDSYKQTSTRGISTHYLGAGTYIIILPSSRSRDPDTVVLDVEVSAGEHRTEIVTQNR